MQFEVSMVSPEMAAKFLSDNASFQRKVRVGVVRDLANSITRGEWQLTHQAVAFDINGKLIDGQHRLNAVVRAGIAVPMLVVRGVDATCFKVIDVGVKRTIADALMIGSREASIVSRIGRTIVGLHKPSPDQSLKLYDEYAPTIEKVLSISGKTSGIFNSAAVHSATVLATHKKPDADGVYELYANILANKFGDLPPVGQALMSMAVKGALNAGSESGRNDLLHRMLYVYDVTKTGNQRVMVTTEYKQATTATLRTEIETLIGNIKV
jgi:hypothetical protein